MQIEQKQNRIYKPQSNTTLSAEETNQVTTELENVIRAGNLTPNAGTLTQVRDAIQNVVDTAANELQEQIDAITSASDVFDVVGTYAQLQAYDTSTVPVNDIVKVLQDETRDNAMTYYRWNGTSWVFVGAEGPYYTVSETDTKFATKAQLPGIATNNKVGLVKPDGVSVTVQADGTLNVSSNVAAALPLFTPIWADHLLNNASYLRADTNSWQSGAVYISAYQHLVDDVNGITSETETVAGTTITFYRATDGHKIVLADQETNVSAIFSATGISWYYILDTANQRFKLPRKNLAKEIYEVHPEVLDWGNKITWNANSVAPSSGVVVFGGTGSDQQVYLRFIPSGETTTYSINCGYNNDAGLSGTFILNAGDRAWSSNGCAGYFVPFKENITRAEDYHLTRYLYFYVGNTVQNETSVDVAEMTETVNNKVDLASSWGFPTGQYDNLTLGATGSKYIAPADGWFVLIKKGSNGQHCTLCQVISGQNYNVSSSSFLVGESDARASLPAKKGQEIQVFFTTTGDLRAFRFIYAQKTN